MEVKFVCDESEDLSLLIREYPDIYHDDTIEGDQEWWIGNCGDHYFDPETAQYNYEDDGDPAEERDFGREFMSREECVEFCGFAETLISSATTMLEGNGSWAQGELRKEKQYREGAKKAKSLLAND